MSGHNELANYNSDLAAARYKIDSAKIATAVRAELSKAQSQSEGRKPSGQEAHHSDIKPQIV